MVGTFSNSRLAALPCERMRDCVFADNFVTLTRMEDNGAQSIGASDACDHGYTLGANPAGVEYRGFVSSSTSFSVVVRFKTSTLQAAGDGLILLTNTTDGCKIHVDPTGIRATHYLASTPATECSVDINYADGAVHTVTYVVDAANNEHHLYVDALAVDTQATSHAGPFNGSGNLVDMGIISGGGGEQWTGNPTIYKVRIFEQILTEAEHDLYHADTLLDFMVQPLAVYRCDDICDNTDGNTIWDRTLNQNDLTKGDGSTSSTFPTHDDVKRTYFFDLVDDYVSDWVTLPSTYTVNALTSSPHAPFPEVTQENTNTLITSLSTPGDHWGYLHNLSLYSGVLTQLELNHAEYQHKYMRDRGRADGAYHRLITEDVCNIAMFLDSDYYVYYNYARNGLSGTGHDVTRGGSSGCTFPNADSRVEIVHDTAFDCGDELTIVFYGSFYTYTAGSGGIQQTFVDKGTNFKFRMNYAALDLNGSTYTCTEGTYNQIAVTLKDGYKPRFYLDGAYQGEGSTTETLTADTTNITIGNNNELNERTQSTVKQVYVGNKALTDDEIRALYEEARAIGATTMETGNRIEVENTYTAAAVAQTFDPGGAFQLIDVVLQFNTAPTTSENIVINSIRNETTAITVPEETYDPSLSSDTTHVFRFDKRFADEVTMSIAYTNTDGRTIKVISTYQLDQSVV